MTAFPGKTRSLEEIVNRVFLSRPDLQDDMAPRSQLPAGTACDAAVGVQAVRPAIKGPLGVEFPHIGGQTGDIPLAGYRADSTR